MLYTLLARLITVPVLVFFGSSIPGPQAFASVTEPAPAILNLESVARARADFENGVPPSVPVQRILTAARGYLKKTPLAVTQKAGLPPGGDRHDFMSLNPNIFVDPADPKKYVYRDGEWNPENDFHPLYPDRGNFNTLKKWVSVLSLAYAITGQSEFATQASRLLETWFIAPATRMNPNLKHAYAWPGKVGQENGWASGIIELQSLHLILDSAVLLRGSDAWTPPKQAALAAWSREMLQWLETSEFGKLHQSSEGNHGVYHDVFRASLAYFAGDLEHARAIVVSAQANRIAKQIAPDGSMPLELKRATSLHYSIYNLQALVLLAEVGERVGVELVHYQTADGRSIRKALDFVAEAALGRKPWPYPQKTTYDPYPIFAFLLRIAEVKFATPDASANSYKKLFASLDAAKFLATEPVSHFTIAP